MEGGKVGEKVGGQIHPKEKLPSKIPTLLELTGYYHIKEAATRDLYSNRCYAKGISTILLFFTCTKNLLKIQAHSQ